MATDLANYAEDAIAKWIGGIARPAATDTRKVSFWTVAPAEDGTGGTEVTGGSYARTAATFATTATPGLIQTSADLSISNMPECDIVAAALHDNSGNFLAIKTGLSKHFEAGQTAAIAAGDLTFQIS